MEAKSGYELRVNLLHLAKDILTERTYMVKDMKQDVKSFTTEEVIEEAQKLYAFVNTK